jgi:hypothetical protein
MSNEKHLYLTFYGRYSEATLDTETWQTGIRLALVFGTVDDVGTLPNNWEPVATSHDEADDNWTLSGNWSVDGPLAQTFDPASYMVDYGIPTAKAWINQNTIHENAYLTGLKLFPIGTDGRAVPAVPYAQGSPIEVVMTDATDHGGGSGTAMPLQLSAVVSNRTLQTGRAGRGRNYIPGPMVNALASSTNPHISTTYAGYYLANHIATLEGLSYTGTGGSTAHVRPIVTGGGYNKYGMITSVRVGNVFDTQRRRRRSLQETVVSDTTDYG